MTLLTHPSVKWAFLAVSVLAGVAALVAYWPDVTQAAPRLPTRNLVLAGGATLVHVGATMLCWRSIVADLGSHLTLRDASRLFFVSQVGKYIPGGIWNVLAVSEMGREYSVPRRTALSGMLVFWLVSVTTGLLAGGLYVVTARVDVPGGPLWVAVGLGAAAVLLSPPVLSRVIDVGLRLLRRPALVREPTAPGLARAALWAVAGWSAAGLQVWAIAAPLGGASASYPAAVGGYALAWTAGFLVVVAPAGAGVREVVLAAVFVGSMGAGAIVTLVLLSRFLVTAADLLLAGAALLLPRRGTPAEGP